MSNKDNAKLLDNYLTSLDVEALNILLGKVLAQLRSRENEQMQVDIITHSKRLRLQSSPK